MNLIEANNFRDAFNAARAFVADLAAGTNLNELDFAPLISDEAAAGAPDIQPVDDPDVNKEPEEADHEDGFGQEEP